MSSLSSWDAFQRAADGSYSITCAASVVSFCDKRLDRRAANEVMSKYSEGCLSSEREKFEKLAEAGDYIQVLGAIWKDKENRLAFLDSISSRLHAPLMNEEAIARFIAAPTVETVIRISLPLLKAAEFRANQDAQCSLDPAVSRGDAYLRLALVYRRALDSQIKKYLPAESLASVEAANKAELNSALLKKVMDVALATKAIELPSPLWIGYHGLSVFIEGAPKMHLESEYKRIRDEFADRVIT